MSIAIKRGAFAQPEAQVCVSCGARHGRCHHTSKLVPVLATHEVNVSNRRWTDGEDDLLIEWYWLEGRSTKTIAQRLTRTVAAVENRIQVLKRERLGRMWL